MNEITVTSPTKVKCLNANGDGYNYIYIDDSCIQLETNVKVTEGNAEVEKKTILGVTAQNIYVISDNPDFKGVIYQDGTTPILDENTLVPKSYVDAKIAEAISNL